MPTDPLTHRCTTCLSGPGEPCYQHRGTGPMRNTPHDARRRAAGEELPGRDSSPKQREAMELGSRFFVVAGALGALDRIVNAPVVPGWSHEDAAELRFARDALNRIDQRRKTRAHIRESNRRHAREQDALQNADMLNR